MKINRSNKLFSMVLKQPCCFDKQERTAERPQQWVASRAGGAAEGAGQNPARR